MLLIRNFTHKLNLITKLSFSYNQPPRPHTIPTQSNVMLPYSINFLHDNQGAVRYPKQLGRGPASGKGKTSTRGHKGQLSRSGGTAHPRFQGGQTPITKRLPKYGRVFRPKQHQILNGVNLKQIDYFVKTGVIDRNEIITIRTLVQKGLAKDVRYGIKLLGKGLQKIDYSLHFEVSDASKMVIKRIQQNGGSIRLVHRTPLKLREHIYPQKYPIPLMDPITPWWKVRKLMRKQEDRGIKIEYKGGKWMQSNPIQKKVDRFVYPVPRVPNPQKIRKRRVELFRRVDYGF